MNGIIVEFASRREFLKRAGILVTSGAVIFPDTVSAQTKSREMENKAEEVSPAEDLMREHGVLRRILLMYEDIQGSLNGGKDFPPEVLGAAAGIIHGFIEQYHEKLEEDYLFPRFEKAGKLVELVKVLKDQHEAGRRLTSYIMKSAMGAALKEDHKRQELRKAMSLFVRMYRPHAAHEDTILFPAFRSIVSARELDSLGEEFERKETELFGEEGFERVVGEAAKLEKSLGIYNLAQFTPSK